MSKLVLLVGPPGSGKSTKSKEYVEQGFIYINQDSQGKQGHQDLFRETVRSNKDVIVDRMNFNKQQRNDYLVTAKNAGYETEIVVLHQPYEVCLDRVLKRIGNHETITDEKGARAALQTFFTKYERPEPGEADKITFIYPEGQKDRVLIVDLDGTLCNVEHRLHFVRRLNDNTVNSGTFGPSTMTLTVGPFKKNWPAFFAGIPNDTVNEWCRDIIWNFSEQGIQTVFCSGRSDNERKATEEWLDEAGLGHFTLYLRNRHDSRRDDIIKEIILDFELLTRYEPYFMIDDRPTVCRMWRRRGYTVLQCNDREF